MASAISRKQRVEKLYAIVWAAMLFGSGGWTLSTAASHKLTRIEHQLLRTVAAPRRDVHEPWQDWIRRETGRSRTLCAKWENPLFVAKSLSLCSWLARSFGAGDPYGEPSRGADDATRWRSSIWWHVIQALDAPSDDARDVVSNWHRRRRMWWPPFWDPSDTGKQGEKAFVARCTRTRVSGNSR